MNNPIDEMKIEFTEIINRLNSMETGDKRIEVLNEAVMFTYKFFQHELTVMQDRMHCDHNGCKVSNLINLLLACKNIIEYGLLPLLEREYMGVVAEAEKEKMN